MSGGWGRAINSCQPFGSGGTIIAQTRLVVQTMPGGLQMPKANDLEGPQDQGGKHGGQKGMPKPAERPGSSADQGIVRDERGQEQPRDKERAQRVSRQDKGGDPPGAKARG
jgi:hypothetical protein